MRDIVKLSSSALDTFASCPLSFYHKYVNEDRPQPKDETTFYADFGTLLHFFAEFYPRTNHYPDMKFDPAPEKWINEHSVGNVLNGYGNQIMERGIVLDVEKMIAIYDSLFHMIDFPKQETADEYYEQGINFIKSLPEYDWSNVIGLESEFKIDLQNGAPPIKGMIDKVERTEEGIVITDYKTSKPYSKNAALKKRQLPIYGMASFFLFDEMPVKYVYDFVRFGKKLEIELPVERLTEVKNQIRFEYMQISAYKRNGSFPANYNDFYCKNFCGFKHLCQRYQDLNN